MARLKNANAVVAHRGFSPENWSNFVSHHDSVLDRRYKIASSERSLVSRASEILGEELSLDKYLLSHVTIMASCDAMEVPNVKLGSVPGAYGRMINRMWNNYWVTPETQQFINNNQDLWDRPVLLASYPTFIGAHSFLEHLQLVEHSKGKIIDAVARDIGPSVYIDLLVANDRKHTQLIQDIESGKLSTLSMGCFPSGAQVTLGDGTRRALEELLPGDRVITHKGNIRKVLNKQIRKYQGDLVKLKAVGLPSEIKCTPNHGFEAFRLRNNCQCGCGEELRPTSSLHRRFKRRFKFGHDKRIFNSNNSYSSEESLRRRSELENIKATTFEKVQAKDLKVGDFLCFPRISNEITSDSWTIGKARLLGYFLAEGSFKKYSHKKTGVEFNFSLEEKTTFVQEVVELLSFEFGLESTIQEREEKSTCTVHVSDRIFAKWCFEHGGEYSHEKKLSEEFLHLPKEFHLNLIGAWINGDGYSKSCLVSGVTASYDLACQIHLMLSKAGIFSRLSCKQDSKIVDLWEKRKNWVRNPETRKFPHLIIEIGATQAQKINEYTSKQTKQYSKVQNMRVMEDKVIFPITNIEKTYFDGLVYNMEVEEDHSYLVEGVAVYNCTVSHTQCTQCGNVAIDETDLCDCQKYQRGNTFIDSFGNIQKVAELCGNKDLDHPTKGVKYIEASWVAVPAFAGAAMRNIVKPEVINISTLKQAQDILSQPPKQWTSEDGLIKAARLGVPSWQKSSYLSKQGFDFGDDDEGDDSGDEEKKEEKKQPLQELEDDIEGYVLDKVRSKIQDKLRKKNQEQAATGELAVSKNDNLREASLRNKYASEVNTLIKVARNDGDFMDRLAVLNRDYGINLDKEFYRAVLQTGSSARYEKTATFINVCEKFMGRRVHEKEARNLWCLGQILSRLDERG